ncbi:hypothetical protein M2351_007420 [Azospirillum canadense]|nr:hypothetical protein [Azospirillum canadense]MCW2242759.1 hypothetical protein [Azospirillum canadense]
MGSSLSHNPLSPRPLTGPNRGHCPFELEDRLAQGVVDLLAIRAMMDAPMAGRAHPSDVARIVRPTVAHTSDVMGFQVRFAVSSNEGRGAPAALADPSGPGEHIAAYRLTALVDAPARAFDRLFVAGGCSFHCSAPESSQMETGRVGVWLRLRSVHIVERFDRHQVEDDPAPHVPKAVWCRFSGCVHTDELAEKPKHPGPILLLEKEQILPLGDVIADRFVPRGEGHIAFLTFTEVAEHLTIVGPAIVIAVLEAALSGDCKYDRMLRGCDDSALALTAVRLVEIAPAIVAMITDEVPEGHLLSLQPGLCGRASTTIACRTGTHKRERNGPMSGALDDRSKSTLMVRALRTGRKTQTRRLASSPLAAVQPGSRSIDATTTFRRCVQTSGNELCRLLGERIQKRRCRNNMRPGFQIDDAPMGAATARASDEPQGVPFHASLPNFSRLSLCAGNVWSLNRYAVSITKSAALRRAHPMCIPITRRTFDNGLFTRKWGNTRTTFLRLAENTFTVHRANIDALTPEVAHADPA